jgi:hypothetical protein
VGRPTCGSDGQRCGRCCARPGGRKKRGGSTSRRGTGVIDAYGDLHPFALEASINYASDLAACGDLAGAIRVGQETLTKCKNSLGENHPDTLAAAANLSIDEAVAGNRPQADRLLTDALRRYEETLTSEHAESRAAAQGIRLTAEIEPW